MARGERQGFPFSFLGGASVLYIQEWVLHFRVTLPRRSTRNNTNFVTIGVGSRVLVRRKRPLMSILRPSTIPLQLCNGSTCFNRPFQYGKYTNIIRRRNRNITLYLHQCNSTTRFVTVLCTMISNIFRRQLRNRIKRMPLFRLPKKDRTRLYPTTMTRLLSNSVTFHRIRVNDDNKILTQTRNNTRSITGASSRPTNVLPISDFRGPIRHSRHIVRRVQISLHLRRLMTNLLRGRLLFMIFISRNISLTRRKIRLPHRNASLIHYQINKRRNANNDGVTLLLIRNLRNFTRNISKLYSRPYRIRRCPHGRWRSNTLTGSRHITNNVSLTVSFIVIRRTTRPRPNR